SIALCNQRCKCKGLHSDEIHVEIRHSGSSAHQRNATLGIILIDPLTAIRIPLCTKKPPVVRTCWQHDSTCCWMLNHIETAEFVWKQSLKICTEVNAQVV